MRIFAVMRNVLQLPAMRMPPDWRQKSHSAAAVGGEQAAVHFKLKVLAQNIEDDARNTTRFLVIGKQDVAPSGTDKTSLVMTAPNIPGARCTNYSSLLQRTVFLGPSWSRVHREQVCGICILR